MSSLLVASNRIQSDTAGLTSPERNDSPNPESMAESPIQLTTDLGGLEHLFRDSQFSTVTHAVSTTLTRATDSLRGPHGGLIPSSLQHAAAAGVSRVDGMPIMSVVDEARHSATPFADALRTSYARVRSLF
jgi:hypothetical protein